MVSLMECDSVLRFEGVSKSYGSLAALSEVDLSVEPGEILALLGPNGAGKTTLIGCASGLIQDFRGRISVGGYDVRRRPRITRRLIGLVSQELNFDGFFNARQALFYQSGYYGVRPDRQRIEQMLRDFSLYEKADTNTRQLSGGMKRRLMICKALMHDPAVLFLDEPTAGVDVELREELWRYVLKLREQGVTIVLTTHYLEEAEQLADRVAVIHRGRILRVQPRERLLADLGRSWAKVSFSRPVPVEEFQNAGAHRIQTLEPSVLRFEMDGVDEEGHGSGSLLSTVVRRCGDLGVSVLEVETGRSSLEEVFRELIRETEPGKEKVEA